MSEIKNAKLGLHGTGDSKCNHLMTVGFKGLMARRAAVGIMR